MSTTQSPSPTPSSITTPADVIRPFVEAHVLAGTVTVIASREKILSLEMTGFADIEAGKPMARDTMFWIASQTKPMTATALMMLVDEGRLTLDDAVEKFLPEFKGQMVIAEKDDDHVLLKKPQHPITVREILSHTAGLPFKSAIEVPTVDMLPIHTGVRSHAMSPLVSEPGTKYEYSNAGTNTAGRLIEVLSGMSYEEFMRARLFEPLGMNDTVWVLSDEQERRLAKTYKPNEEKTALVETRTDQLFYPLTDRRRQPFPAGGLFSTVGDVARFCQMILNGGELDGRRYVSEEAIKQMTSKQTGDLEANYGLAWITEKGSYGHSGALATNMTIDPKLGIAMVFLVQHGTWTIDHVREAFYAAGREWVGGGGV